VIVSIPQPAMEQHRMNARDIMTTEVVSISPETPTNKVAQRLGEKGISAVPVVDDAGAPIGMVSEGDLIGRNEAEREARRDWC
jgi:CBS domain-containing protein